MNKALTVVVLAVAAAVILWVSKEVHELVHRVWFGHRLTSMVRTGHLSRAGASLLWFCYWFAREDDVPVQLRLTDPNDVLGPRLVEATEQIFRRYGLPDEALQELADELNDTALAPDRPYLAAPGHTMQVLMRIDRKYRIQ